MAQVFETGVHKIHNLTIDEVKARVFSDAAVVTGRTRGVGEFEGAGYDVVIRFTDVFVRRAGRWQAVASHASLIQGSEAGRAVQQGAAPNGIPGAVRLILDQRYAGWRVASVSSEVRDWVGDRLGPTPNVIVGDFDGNGRADYAVLIEYPNTDAPEKAYTHYLEVLAFLDEAGSPRLVRVRDRQPGPNPEQFLTLQRRGAEGFDFEANKKFTYAYDSIGEWYFSKAGGTYIFSDGRFRYVHEAD